MIERDFRDARRSRRELFRSVLDERLVRSSRVMTATSIEVSEISDKALRRHKVSRACEKRESGLARLDRKRK